MLSSVALREPVTEMKDELVRASFVLNKDSKDEDRDIQVAELGKIFEYIELADGTKERFQLFCDSHLGHEILLPDTQEEKWSQEFSDASKGKSVFNDDGTFQKWVTNLFPRMEPIQLGFLSQEIRELIENDSIEAKHCLDQLDSNKKNRINKAIEKFGEKFVTGYLMVATKSLMVREFIRLRETEKNAKFVNIIVKLVEHQLAIHSALLSEYQKVENTRLLKKLSADEGIWDAFLNDTDEVLPSVYSDNTRVMSLLRLGNAFAALPEKYTIHLFARHELLYEVEKFIKEQKGNGDVEDLANKLARLDFQQESEAQVSEFDVMLEKEQYAPLMFEYLLQKIENSLKNIKDKGFKEQCERLYKQLHQQGDELLNDVRCDKEDIGSHVKKLQRFCLVVEAVNDETVDICAEILRFYVPFPEVFCDTNGRYFNNIELYFKAAIDCLTDGEDVSDLHLLIPALKLANAIVAADLKNERYKSFAFSIIPDLSKSQPCKEDNKLMSSYLKVFNKIYSKIRVHERSVEEGEEKEDFSEGRAEKSKTDIFGEYRQTVLITERLKRTGVDERITVKECSDIFNDVTDKLMSGDVTFETEYPLIAINSILRKLEVRAAGVNHRPRAEEFNSITQPYEKVKSILIRACLRKEIFYSEMGKQFIGDINNFIKLEANAERDIRLYETFERLQKLYEMSVGKKDALSIAATKIYSDACVEFKRTLRGGPTDLTQEQLNQVLFNVNEVIVAIQNNRPFSSKLTNLNNLQKTLPSKVNGAGVILGSLICFIGLATMVAACYFSPMTLGSSLVAGEKIGYAIVCAGLLMAGKGLHVISSHSSSGVPKSLGGFLSAASNSKRKLPPGRLQEDDIHDMSLLPSSGTGTLKLKKHPAR